MKPIQEKDQISRLGVAYKPHNDDREEREIAGELLRILEWHEKENDSPVYYLRSPATASYFELDQEEKIGFEIATWVNALEQALKPVGDCSNLERLSPTLHGICQSRPLEESQATLARTLRMLSLLEVLLLPEKYSLGNPYRGIRSTFEKSEAAIKLKKLIDRLILSHFRLQPLGDSSQSPENQVGWCVSLPLLLIVAVAESQCERAQPFTWEAYSAGRAFEELRRLWGKIDETVLNTVALLIRCQSAIGQLMRKSSGGGLLRLVSSKESFFCYESKDIFDMLILLAIVEEARNHVIPSPSNKVDDPFNAGTSRPWDEQFNFEKQISLYLEFNPKNLDDKPTWAYFRPLYLGLSDDEKGKKAANAFKDTIEERAKAQYKNSGSQWNDFEVISIGQDQSKPPLSQLFGDIVRHLGALEEKDRGEFFSRYFDLRVLEVPNPFIGKKEPREKTLQVVLKDYLAAKRLLFPAAESLFSKDTNIQPRPIADKDHTAGDLFDYLFEVSIIEMKLGKDARWEAPTESPTQIQSPYAPYPLIKRITGIIQRLMPDQCFTIPLSIDRLPTEWIYLPCGIKKSNEMSKRILSNFLLATVLNRAMAAGIRYAEIDLKNLSSRPPVSTKVPSDKLMQPEDWQILVENLYTSEGYEDLLGRYLRDFNTQRENVVFKTRLARDVRQVPDSSAALAVGSVHDDFKQYLTAKNQTCFWLLGVDIGGTLTKCQLFTLNSSGAEYKPCGSVFHMSTRFPGDTRDEIGKEQNAAKRAQIATREFAKRLVELVKKRSVKELQTMDHFLLAIGITWPGPVRENHVAGTSGILEQFGLTRNIKNNKIDDVWEVDVTKAVQQAWEEEFGPARPFVALLNDGDADGVGAVIGTESKTSSTEPDRSVVSVVKLGTGLAGAVLDSDQGRLLLRPGLFEWGKIVLDLGAPKRKGFPQGVAADYLSKRCLPQLAAIHGKGGQYKKSDDADSAEIGLIFEMSKSDEPKGPYERLRLECGAIQAERRPPFGMAVSAEVYRLVYNVPDAEPDLIFEVRLGMSSYGDVGEELKRRLDNFGRVRLERLIGKLPTAESTENEAKQVCENENFQQAAKLANECITCLGHYLGDFCVLLHDQLGVNEVRLTGGVLSNKTGEYAMNAACQRVGMYGLKMVSAGVKEAYLIQESGSSFDGDTISEIVNDKKDELKVERGSLGAAFFAAAAFIQEQKQEELQKLRVMLLQLPSGAHVSIDGVIVLLLNKEKIFAGYAVSENDLLRFMKIHGPALRFFQTHDPNDFVRW